MQTIHRFSTMDSETKVPYLFRALIAPPLLGGFWKLLINNNNNILKKYKKLISL